MTSIALKNATKYWKRYSCGTWHYL